jgi:hypothetical protein
VLAVLATLLVPAVAQATTKQYVLPHPKREHCRVHYVKKVERVKRREHHRTVKVRETFCIYVAPKPATPPTTPPATVVAPRTAHLHAHLDPSFVQSPTNPFAITYSYSASASYSTGGVSEESPEPNLPEGVLNLYADGLLACSINVGGNVTGGECPTHETMGPHTVVVTYTSGQTSATETSIETVSPFPVASTTTSLSLGARECETKEEVMADTEQAIEHSCTYTVTASTSEPEQVVTLLLKGTAASFDAYRPAGYGPPSITLPAHGTCTITVTSWQSYWHWAWSASGSANCPGSATEGPEGVQHLQPFEPVWQLAAQGSANPSFGEGGGGWTASESEAQTLTS